MVCRAILYLPPLCVSRRKSTQERNHQCFGGHGAQVVSLHHDASHGVFAYDGNRDACDESRLVVVLVAAHQAVGAFVSLWLSLLFRACSQGIRQKEFFPFVQTMSTHQ